MASDYNKNLEKEINSLIVALEEKSDWPHNSKPVIDQIIANLRSNKTEDKETIEAEFRVLDENGKEVKTEKEKSGWFKGFRNKEKVDAKIIVVDQNGVEGKGVFFLKSFMQGDKLTVSALLTSGTKTLKDFKITWLLVDNKKSVIPTPGAKKGYLKGDKSPIVIDTETLNFGEEKSKAINITLDVNSGETGKLLSRVNKTIKVLAKPKEKEVKKVTPPLTNTKEEEIVLKLENMKGEGKHDETDPEEIINESEKAIIAELSTNNNDSLKFEWLLLDGKKIKEKVKSEANSLTYSNLYKILKEEKTYKLLCRILNPKAGLRATLKANLSDISKVRYLLNKKGEIIEDYIFVKKSVGVAAPSPAVEKKGLFERIKEKFTKKKEEVEVPTPSKEKLDPRIIRIYHGKTLPKKKRGK